MADVFLAMAQGPGAFNKLVVVKRLRRLMDMDGRHVLMFMDEAKLSARMNHPNIVQTYEVGSDQGDYFIVMEYLEGQTLKHVVRAVSQGAHGAAAFRRGTWLRIVAEMLRGLHYAHELRDFDGAPLGIVHRDVSPHNIFITYDGAVKLVDFGVAKATVNSTHTESGIYKGKLTYMSPEQVTAGKTVDRRADIFAAGVVLWELLAGRRLFEGDQMSVMHQLVAGRIPRLSEICPDIPIALDQIAAKALERDPARRYQTAQEMCDVLESYLEWSGEDVRSEHLGACMQRVFAESRASMRQQIKNQLDRAGGIIGAIEVPGSWTMSGLGAVTSVSGSGGALPYVGDGSGSEVVRRSAVTSESASLRAAMVPAPTSRRGYLVKASGLVALVAIAGASGYLLSEHRRAGEAAAVSPPAESKAVSASAGESPPPRANVFIVSDPPDAVVSWRGKVLGKTPLRTELPPGTQVVVVSRADCFDETLMLTLSAAETVERSVKLRTKNYDKSYEPAAPGSPSTDDKAVR